MRHSRSLLVALLAAAAWCPLAVAQPAPGSTAGAPPAPSQPTAAPPAPTAPATAPPPAPTSPAPPPAQPPPPPPAAPPATAAPPPAPSAPPHPPPEDLWWETYQPRERHGAKIPLTIIGSALGGIGAITLLVAGVTWLSAWGHSRELEDECPDHYCTIGTRGGDAYEDARDLSNASQVMVAVGIPLIAGGISLAVIGAGLRGSADGPRYSATLRTHGQGASLEVTF